MTRSNYRPWTAHDIARAAELWHEHCTRKYGDGPIPHGLQLEVSNIIGKALGRTAAGVQTRLHDRGPTFSERSRYHRVPAKPDDVQIDRQRRADARDRMNLTGLLLGDPPPGYSALDKMQGQNP